MICEICKEENHGEPEDFAPVCDACLKRFQELEKENEELRVEIERLKEWDVRGYWGP